MHNVEIRLARYTRREQFLLIAGGMVVVFALVYFGLLYPLQQSLVEAERKFLTSEGQYNRVTALLKHVTPQRPKRTTLNANDQTTDIRTAVITVADQQQVTLTRIRQERSGLMTVWLDQVESPVFYRLIQQLETDYHIVADQVTLQATALQATAGQAVKGPQALRAQLLLRQRKP